jgi:hypothetical protein
MATTYTSWLSQFSNLLAVDPADPNFLVMKDSAIDYAEQRLYRELDLLATRVADANFAFTPNNRNFTLPTDAVNFLVVEQINAITPAFTLASNGTRNPLTRTSRDWIDWCYPISTLNTGVPMFWAMTSNTTIIVGPPPDAAYTVEVIGTERPTPLSATNSATYLTSFLPDLWLAATMIFGMGYQRDFGAQSDTPQGAQSWEATYQNLIQSANIEEIRKKYESQGWTDKQPSTIASPPRV